jgi:tetratricopeptide (TPR) repeat protein
MMQTKNTKELFEAGILAFTNSRYENSIDLFTRVIEKDTDNTLAFVSRGAAYLKLNMSDPAYNDFDHAAAIDPEYARAYHMRGLAGEKRGNDRQAMADFDRAIALDPEYPAAYYSRATLHAKMGHSQEAQADIQMVTHLQGVNVESYMNENNVWRTEHMRVEEYLETELDR